MDKEEFSNVFVTGFGTLVILPGSDTTDLGRVLLEEEGREREEEEEEEDPTIVFDAKEAEEADVCISLNSLSNSSSS